MLALRKRGSARRTVTRGIGGLLAIATSIALGVVFAGSAQAAGAVLQVGPGQTYHTISAALAAAVNGDTIDVAAGTYVENINITKYISLIGAGSASVTLMSSAAGGISPLRVTGVPRSADKSTIIAGMTVTDGGLQPQSGDGGDATIVGSSPVLHDLVLSGGISAYGGGIAIRDSSNPLLYNNTITNNTATQGGGGVFIENASNPVLINNTITSNTTKGWTQGAGGGSSGGGVYLGNDKPAGGAAIPVLLHNTISNNTADFAGGGIINATNINAIIQGNTISGNSAGYGGGIHIEAVGSTSTIQGNTITGNTATIANHSNAGHGGGISIFNQSKPSITGNTISNNTASTDGAGIVAAENSNSIISSNVISNNKLTGTGQNDGAGLLAANATIVATNNVFSGNNGGVGGALNIQTNVTATIANNTIVNNIENQVYGGAIFVGSTNGTVIIANNVFTKNQGYQIYEQGTSTSRVNNNFLGNPSSAAPFGTGEYFNDTNHGLNTTASSASFIGKVIPKDSGNIGDANDGVVGFTDFANGDFSLLSTSGAIDGGTTNLDGKTTVPVDIRGVARTGAWDIGAYEYEANATVASDPVLSGTPQVSSVLSVTPGSGWGAAPSTLSYQWLSNGSPVGGATGTTYSPHLSDVGNTLSVAVTATYNGVYSRSITTPVTAAVTRGPYFSDVPFSSPFSTYVEWIAAQGLSTGTANPPYAPLYKPTDAVSRQAMAAFLYRLSGDTFAAPDTPTFADVDTNSSFYTAIEWMAANGISTGTAQPSGPPLFKPADPVSRQAMALFLARYDHVDTSTPPTEQSFADVPIDASAAAAIAWMAQTGISTGTGQPSGLPLYKPADPVSRQAMAAFLYRLAALSKP